MSEISSNEISKFIGPDLLFSYWIYVWAFVYYFAKGDSKIVQNIHYYGNPVLAILFALVENILTLILLILHCVHYKTILMYALMILIVKGIPLYILRENKIHFWRDMFVLFSMFLLYNIYLLWKDTNILEIYKKTLDAVSKGERSTPFFYIASMTILG